MPGCLGSIRTQIDLLGMRRRPDRNIELCVIELKTTSKTEDGHAQSYDDVCTKLAAFEFAGNKMRNTERNGHRRSHPLPFAGRSADSPSFRYPGRLWAARAGQPVADAVPD